MERQLGAHRRAESLGCQDWGHIRQHSKEYRVCNEEWRLPVHKRDRLIRWSDVRFARTIRTTPEVEVRVWDSTAGLDNLKRVLAASITVWVDWEDVVEV